MLREAKRIMVCIEPKLPVRYNSKDEFKIDKSTEYKTFDHLKKSIMSTLAEERTPPVVRKLVNLFYPIWDYYTKFYLYKNRIYDQHPDFKDLYNDMYCNCIDLLSKVQAKGNNFNRIKRYFNKSIGGWLYNRLYKKQKKNIEFTKNDIVMELQVDYKDHFEEVNYSIDLDNLEKHIDREQHIYFELYSVLFGSAVMKRKELYISKFRNDAYAEYYSTGKLLSAVELFKNRFGRIFLNEEKTVNIGS